MDESIPVDIASRRVPRNIPARCPICGAEPSQSGRPRVDGIGVYRAYFLCPNSHVWGVEWANCDEQGAS